MSETSRRVAIFKIIDDAWKSESDRDPHEDAADAIDAMIDTAIARAVSTRDAEWGTILLKIVGGNQSGESPHPCPDEASIRAFLARAVEEVKKERDRILMESHATTTRAIEGERRKHDINESRDGHYVCWACHEALRAPGEKA